MTTPQKDTAGSERDAPKHWCETCEGTGSVYQEHQAGCHVGGDYPCPDCDGKGYWTPRASQPSGAAGGEVESLREQCDALRRALEVIAVGDSTDPVRDAGDELVALGHWRQEGLDGHREEIAQGKWPASLASPSSGGWQWVPVEPTDAMTWAGHQARYPVTNSITVIYRAMLNAAPPAPQSSGESHE